MFKKILFLFGVLIASVALAATGPFTQYQTLTAAALNAALATPNITGGTIDNVVIGGNTPVSIYASTGTLGTLTASSVSSTGNIAANGVLQGHTGLLITNQGTASDTTDGARLVYSSPYAYIGAGSADGIQFGNGGLNASGVPATIFGGFSASGVFSASSVIATALQTSSGVVGVSAASAPSAGQVLTATSGSAATWQTFTSASLSSNQTFTGVNSFSNASSTFAGNAATATTATTATNLLGGTALSSQFGIQPAVGYGGGVVQSGGSGTSVTLNKMAGQITMYPFTGTPGTTLLFTVFNSMVAANDVVVLSCGNAQGVILNSNVSTGAFGVFLYIPPGISLGSVTLFIDFVVIKGTIN